MKTMAFFLIIFGISIAVATFIEAKFGTPAARVLIYNALWFEILLTLLAVNLGGNIFGYRLLSKKKITIGIFHIAFILILIGAGITRYIGFEGVMHIREGETENQFLSESTYLKIKLSDNNSRKKLNHKALFSVLSKKSVDFEIPFNGKTIRIKSTDFIPFATRKLVESVDGKPYISIMAIDGNEKKDIHIEYGGIYDFYDMRFAFGDTTLQEAVLFKKKNGNIYFRSPFDVDKTSMMGSKSSKLISGFWYPFEKRHLYQADSIKFVFRSYLPSGEMKYFTSAHSNKGNYSNVVIIKASSGNDNKTFTLSGGKGTIGEEERNQVNGVDISMSYGAKKMSLPFYLKLKDFKIDRYPGSNSPSSYTSDVLLIDKKRDFVQSFNIYMNNVLSYKGYRFYQSSYDEDEKGTILTLNHDFFGTFITYTGYFFLFFGMIISLFIKNSRFTRLSKKVKTTKKVKKLSILIFLFISCGQIHGQTGSQTGLHPVYQPVQKEHAREFGALYVQDSKGRTKPVNTLAHELLRKIARKKSLFGLDANQVFLGMTIAPSEWKKVPVIKITHPKIKQIVDLDGEFASFDDFVRPSGKNRYILSAYVNEAYMKNPSQRTKLDKEVLKIDERVNICYMVFTQRFLKIFPHREEESSDWYLPDNDKTIITHEDTISLGNIAKAYFRTVNLARESGQWEKADKLLSVISVYQQRYGGSIIPSPLKTKLELFYNEANLFKRLFNVYLLSGLVFLFFLFIAVSRKKFNIKYIRLIIYIIIIPSFIAHTLGLGIRWYISGHAPWSNGYESMIYLAWVSILAGLIFSRRSPFTLAATAILSGLGLMVAHLSWMDPEITSLVPVLKSYWLTLHVSIITASYGFFGMSAFLGLFNLILMIMQRKQHSKINTTIENLSSINEMSLIIGLYLLTIGTFLGGIWANESWGRYWGWDPKETWSLITILVYTFVLHMRFIPSLYNRYTLNFFSLLSFGSVLMTYFGVNYFLSGLHSYAGEVSLDVPTSLYISVMVCFTIGLLAFLKEYNIKSPPK